MSSAHRLVLVVCLLASSCSQAATVDAGTAENVEPSESIVAPSELTLTEPLLPTSDDDGLPGFNGLVKKGCVSGAEVEGSEFELWGWAPISDAVAASNVTIEGTITAISEPRITTLKFTGGISQFYFRVVDIKVDRSEVHRGRLDLPATVRVSLGGAGVGVERENLCYGGDGMQDERERPMDVGSQVIVVGRWGGGSPIVGFDGPVLDLPRLLNTFWVVEDGKAVSVVYLEPTDTAVLWDRLQQEISAQREGRTLEVNDSFSNPPTQPEPAPETLVWPGPPGIDVPDTVTIPTPASD